MEKRLKLSREERDQIVADIKNYFMEERGEEIGDLAAGLLLDFLCMKMGPLYYNRGLKDAHVFMQDKLEDLPALEIWKTD